MDFSKTLFVTSYFLICIVVTSANIVWIFKDSRVNVTAFRAPLPDRFKGKASYREQQPLHDFAIDIPGQRSVLHTKHGYKYWDYNAKKVYVVENNTLSGYDNMFETNSSTKLPIVDPTKDFQMVITLESLDKVQGENLIRYMLSLKKTMDEKVYHMNARLSKGNLNVTIPRNGYLINPFYSYQYSEIEILTEEEANSVFPQLLH